MSHNLLTVALLALCPIALSTAAKPAPNIAISAVPAAQAGSVALVGPSNSDLSSTCTGSAAPVTQPSPATSRISVQLGHGAVKVAASAKRPGRKSRKKWDTSVLASNPGGLTQAQLDRAARVAHDALSYRGAPYVWGGNGRGGVFDCSGFTQYLYAKKGIKLPHSAKLQFSMGSPVDRSELKDGDLVFFNTARGPLTHVGMYIGNGVFIHAANPHKGVVTSRLDGSYYGSRFAGARRYASG